MSLSEFLIFNSVEEPKTKSLILPEFPSIIIPSYSPRTTSTVTEQEDKLPRMTDSEVTSSQNESVTELPKPQNISSTTQTSYNNDISFEELIKLENLPIRITSGFRGKGSLRGGKTALGRRSNHNRLDDKGNPMAYDIAPKQGYTFEDIRKSLYKNPRVVDWFRKRNWGVLEEMLDGRRGFYDVNGGFHYTGATGPHFHIGPDSHAVRNYNFTIAKGLQGLKFPFIFSGGGNSPFLEFKTVEEPKVELNLPTMDSPLDISGWADLVTDSGKIIVKSNLPKMIDNERQPVLQLQNNSLIQLDNSPLSNESSTIQLLTSAKLKTSKGADSLSQIIDEVSNESGFEGLKDPETKLIIMLQAQRESNFNPTVKARTSTAVGYFLFIDGTRKKFSNVSKDEFLNNPKEQVRAAYKLYQNIWSTSDAKELALKGYNKAQITALGWWYPRSMLMVLNGKDNFSLGGYSIKKALNDYK